MLRFLTATLLSCRILYQANCEGLPDRHIPDHHSRIAFGSCSKQHRKFELAQIFAVIASQKPQSWIWTGDAIYPPTYVSNVKTWQTLYREMATTPAYANFIKNTPVVDGVYDDHDYGINDGGKEYALKNQSKEEFLNFIGEPKNSPRRSRDGVYTSLTYGEDPYKTKLILLDTRYNKDEYWLTRLGATDPVIGLLLAFLRLVLSYIGYKSNYDGDVLGQTQWNWLEDQLTNSTALVHIVVSSIQVMTPFPLIESWGAYYQSRQRLFHLFQKTKPRGLILISGDVHFGQILGDDDKVVEITSSGLTHSQSDYGYIWSLFEKFIIVNGTRYYNQRNFGLLDIAHNTDDEGVVESHVVASVLGHTGETKMKADLRFRSDDDPSDRLIYFDTVGRSIPQLRWNHFIKRSLIVTVLAAWLIQFGVGILMKFYQTCLKRRITAKQD